MPLFVLLIGLVCSCSNEDYNINVLQDIVKNKMSFIDPDLDEVFDMQTLPVINIKVGEEDWNELLLKYDKNKNVKDYIRCDFSIEKGSKLVTLPNSGLRLHGNTSRRRPEGNTGELHSPASIFHHCHYMVNVDKFVKGNSHFFNNIKKINFKWFHNDPTYVREIYCYDLFKRFDIWSVGYASYCRMNLKVDGDDNAKYLGVYGMYEIVDEDYLERREHLFGSSKGFLWKCSNAGLISTDDGKFFIDDNSTELHPFELKEGKKDFEKAKNQFKNFITYLNEKEGADFESWIESVCDVQLLIRTFAVNVALGNWDDYSNGYNNYYIYFNSRDAYNYKFFFIPYDLDETLGRSNPNVSWDPVIQNPFEWGDPNKVDFFKKIVSIPKYKRLYIEALRELASSSKDFIAVESSINRITNWQTMLCPYVENDTGQDMVIEDSPGAWSGQDRYRLTKLGGGISLS